MNITDFKDSLEYLFKAELTAYVHGHSGIGKSSVIKEYAKSKGWHFFPLYLGTQSDLGDILGLADFVRDKNGTAVATTFATPEWLKNTIDYCNNNPNSGAILFLDEFNRARRDVLQGMFSLALDKTFHTIKLPKNCHIVAAGNPNTEEYNVTDVNETALMARFVHIKLEPTTQEWVQYAKAKSFDNTLLSFINEHPTALEDNKTDFTLPIKVDRRAYERLNNIMALTPPKHLLFQLMAGIIGIERTVMYQQHLADSTKPLEATAILDGSGLDKVKGWSNGDDTKSALLKGTIENIKTYMTTVSAETPPKVLTDAENTNLLTFLTIIPKELTFVLLRDLMFKNISTFDTFKKLPNVQQTLIDLLKPIKDIK